MVGEYTERSLLAVRDHAHLVLGAVLPPRPRFRERTGGGPGRLRHPDRHEHARDLLRQAAEIRVRHRSRPEVLGVKPDNVIMVELHDRVPVEEVERAGLTVIEAVDELAMVAFSDTAELREFERRCNAYNGPIPLGQDRPRYEGLLDKVKLVRQVAPEDVLDPDVRGLGDEIVRVDTSGWTPDDTAEAERRHRELRLILERAGAEIQDSVLNPFAGLSAFRVDILGSRIAELADTSRVRSIRRRPRPDLGQIAAFRAAAADLPSVDPPARSAPTVGIVDSGLRDDHPLIRPVVASVTSIGDLPTRDDHGHGTLVTSLALFGSLEEDLHSGRQLRPAARIVSVRVLDDQACFPDANLWERDVEAGITAAADAGARIIVLSLGDRRSPYRPPGPVPVAALVDRLSRERGLVVVVSTGNVAGEEFPSDAGLEHSYPEWLLAGPDTGLLPPSMASLALTVGGLVGGWRQGLRRHLDDAHQRPMGQPGHPSAHTRRGPGVENAIKPELCAPSGTMTFLLGDRRVVPDVRTNHLVGAAGDADPPRLLNSASGTSFAAPLVAHTAARVLGRYPALSANAVRALVLAGAVDVDTVMRGGSDIENAKQQRRLTGHGRVDPDRATNSTDHRALLLADTEIPVNGVPIPTAFFNALEIVVRVTVAHDPAVRATRLDYLANRMQVYAFRGVDVDVVRQRYEHDARTEHGSPEALARHHLALQPAAGPSSHGANQCSTITYHRSWPAELRGTDLVLAVRNTARWDDAATQTYALCLMLQTDEQAAPLYVDLRAQLQTLAEIEPEAEI